MSSAPTCAASRSPVTVPMATVIWAVRYEGPVAARMLARKPRMLVAVELANRTARIAWALIVTGHPIVPRCGHWRLLASITEGGADVDENDEDRP